MGTLYIVATPIGNLEDVTFRSLRVLKECDIVFAEDTRVTKKLLSHYHIQKPVFRYDEHVAERMHAEVIRMLKGGKEIAVVSDAGTPGIADPGSRLVSYIREHMPATAIHPIPGPSALVAALSASGIAADRFTFLGYPPHKKGRQTFFKELAEIKTRPIVLYESPHRLQKTVANISVACGADIRVFILREISKIHEESFSGAIRAAESHFIGEKLRGEFVLIIV